jgi:hypothetical protein
MLYPLNVFDPDLATTGYALWCVLESHLDLDDYHCTSDTVCVSFGHQSNGVPYLDCYGNGYPYRTSFRIDPNKRPLEHTGTLTVCLPHPTEPDELLDPCTYALSLAQLITLLPYLSDRKLRNDMLSLLPPA